MDKTVYVQLRGYRVRERDEDYIIEIFSGAYGRPARSCIVVKKEDCPAGEETPWTWDKVEAVIGKSSFAK